jgi:hypothetical protein
VFPLSRPTLQSLLRLIIPHLPPLNFSRRIQHHRIPLMKKIIAILALLCAAVFAGIFLWQGRSVATPEWAVVERRAMGAVFEERGWLEASQVTPVALGAGGEIREMAPEGSLVKPGDLVVAVDTTGIKDNLDRREEDVEANSNRLEIARFRRVRTEQETRKNIIVTADRLKLAEMEYEEIRTGLRPEDRRLLEITTELRTIEREDAEEAFLRQSNLVARALASPITLKITTAALLPRPPRRRRRKSNTPCAPRRRARMRCWNGSSR